MRSKSALALLSVCLAGSVQADDLEPRLAHLREMRNEQRGLRTPSLVGLREVRVEGSSFLGPGPDDTPEWDTFATTRLKFLGVKVAGQISDAAHRGDLRFAVETDAAPLDLAAVADRRKTLDQAMREAYENPLRGRVEVELYQQVSLPRAPDQPISARTWHWELAIERPTRVDLRRVLAEGLAAFAEDLRAANPGP